MRAAGAIYDFWSGGHFSKKRKMAPLPSSERTMFSPNKKMKTYGKSGNVAPNDRHSIVSLTKAATRHRGKPTNFKKPKNVKVSKQFKEKVTKALSSKTVSGSWDQISYDTIGINSIPDNGQLCDGLASLIGNDYSDWAFDPEDILHAASVLWNFKTDSQTSRAWNVEQNLGVSLPNPFPTQEIGDIAAASGPGLQRFLMNMKINVKRCYEVYKLKNNTQRTVVMKIYLCAPKITGVKFKANAAIAQNAAAPASYDIESAIGEPRNVWRNELYKQYVTNINVSGADHETLYNSPKDCPGFNKVYKTDETTIVLEPGQVTDYYIQGPSNFEIDYNSLFRNTAGGVDHLPQPSVYQGIQKFMRYPLFTAYLDLVTDGGLSGRYAPTSNASQKLAISVERQMKISMEMPEIVGGAHGVNVAQNTQYAGIEENNLRRDCYFRKVYSNVGPFVDGFVVNVQNPVIPIEQSNPPDP